MSTTNFIKYILATICTFLSITVSSQEVKLTLTVQPYDLGDFLGNQKDLVTDLTLIGQINAYDIETIREMAKLTKINLANVSLVPGGNFMGIEVVANQVPQCMFFTLSNLTSITLPINITTIGDQAFQDCKSLSAITIPSGVLSLGKLAFANCTSLTSVTLNNNLKTISDNTFWNCTSLSAITLPQNVTTIGQGAFAICTSLSQFTVSSGNTSFSSVDGVLFSKDKTTLIAYPNSKSSVYTTPSGTSSIGSYAFESCYGLGSVTISSEITSIGEGAFFNCIGLTSVIVGNKVPAIGINVFYNCSSLASITLPNSVTSIGWNAFGLCSSLSTIDLGNSIASIDIYAFTNCTGLKSITIPKTTTSILEWAFNNCTGLTEFHTKALIPPSAYSSSFYAIDKNACYLYIPKGTSTKYKGATGWSDFKNIIEENTTSVIQTNADSLKVYVVENAIIIEDISLNNEISIYNATGILIEKIRATDNTMRITMPVNQIYLIKIMNKVFKVAL